MILQTINLTDVDLLEMLTLIPLPKAIPWLLQHCGGEIGIADLLEIAKCFKTLSNVLAKLERDDVVTVVGSVVKLNSGSTSSQHHPDVEPESVPTSNPSSSRIRPEFVPTSGNTVQDGENHSPSRERARISVSLSSLEPKKQIQTPTEKARKTRASKSSDPPEIPDALPDDLALVAGVPEAWAAFEKMRREHAKHPALTNFTRWRIWKLLRKFRAEGHDIEESVARSANKGWADVFRPDPPGGAVQQVKTAPIGKPFPTRDVPNGYHPDLLDPNFRKNRPPPNPLDIPPPPEPGDPEW